MQMRVREREGKRKYGFSVANDTKFRLKFTLFSDMARRVASFGSAMNQSTENGKKKKQKRKTGKKEFHNFGYKFHFPKTTMTRARRLSRSRLSAFEKQTLLSLCQVWFNSVCSSLNYTKRPRQSKAHYRVFRRIFLAYFGWSSGIQTDRVHHQHALARPLQSQPLSKSFIGEQSKYRYSTANNSGLSENFWYWTIKADGRHSSSGNGNSICRRVEQKLQRKHNHTTGKGYF